MKMIAAHVASGTRTPRMTATPIANPCRSSSLYHLMIAATGSRSLRAQSATRWASAGKALPPMRSADVARQTSCLRVAAPRAASPGRRVLARAVSLRVRLAGQACADAPPRRGGVRSRDPVPFNDVSLLLASFVFASHPLGQLPAERVDALDDLVAQVDGYEPEEVQICPIRRS